MRENDIVEDIRLVATKMGLNSKKDRLSREDYFSNGGKFSHHDIYQDGMSWTYYCNLAGYMDKSIKTVSDEMYFERLKEAVIRLGRYPKVFERKKFGLNFMKSRWPTLSATINDAILKGYVNDLDGRTQVCKLEHRTESLLTDTNDISDELLIPPIPKNTKRTRWKRIGLLSFPYAPHDEQGVVAIFSILCDRGILPFQIVDLNGGKGIDAVCFDKLNKCLIRIEFKFRLSKYSFNHDLDSFEKIVCWENGWLEIAKDVYELKTILKDIEK